MSQSPTGAGPGPTPPSITSLDLFSGAGGLTAGLHLSERIKTVRAVEVDTPAAATFEANHGVGLVYNGTVEEWLRTEDVPEVDLVVGGPPCQGFSMLNRNKVGVHRNGLWERYVEALVLARPKWFVMENVATFLKTPEYRQLLESTGADGVLRDYRLGARVLLAADYGSAQMRRRTVVLGHHRDLDAPLWPRRTHVKSTYATVKEALSGVTSSVIDTELPDRDLVFNEKRLRGPFQTRELHLGRHYESLSLERFSHISPGGNRFDLPLELQTPGWRRHLHGSGDVMGRLAWDKPSVTIRTEFFKPEKGRYLHPEEDRALTHLEAALIQGFPDNYLWVGSKTDIARQIGNAVPLALGEAIGRVLVDAADGGGVNGEPDEGLPLDWSDSRAG